MLFKIAARVSHAHRATSRFIWPNRNALISRSGSENWFLISLAYKDAMRSLRRTERESVPVGGGSSPPHPGGFGPKRPAGITTGLRGKDFPRCTGGGREPGTPRPAGGPPRER